jgi:penicillin-binding protein 2
MRRDPGLDKLFTRRAAILAGGKAVLLTALGTRLYYLQVVRSDRYATLADENRINLRLLAPPRGKIYDRFGVPLALNRQTFRVLLVSEQTPDIGRTLDALGHIIEIGEPERRRVTRETARRRGFVPVTVRGNLSWPEVARIEVNAPDLPGVGIDVGESRFYPFRTVASHLVGYVAAVSEAERGDDPLLELPGFRIGKDGIERTHDTALRGRAGDSQVEVNALGRVIRELRRREGTPGSEIVLTVDIGLQEYASRRLGDESAAAVVLDAHSGEVLALASTPGFDPNGFSDGLSAREWEEVVSNPKAPLTNKAIAGQFAPGSVVKPAVALAGLEAGAIDPKETVFCSGTLKFFDLTLHCWKRGGHGALALHDAIAQSCDIYFYELARRLGIQRIGAMARRLGLGATLGVDLPGERPGLLPSPEWKLATIGQPWTKGETLLAGIGQGYVLTTPLQLAVMTARLVNGGVGVTPRVTKQVRGADGGTTLGATEAPTLGIARGSLEFVRRAMAAVVNHPKGTAYRARITEPGMAMGGKTGTVQVHRISERERRQGLRKNEDRPWRLRDHAMFVGFAPVERPRYAVAVVVEHGGGGASTAAPIARDILVEAQRRDSAGNGPPRQLAAGPPARAARGED